AQIDAMAGRLLPSSLTFEVLPAPKQLRLWADSDGLVSALLNLLLNARDAVDQTGQVTLWASSAGAEDLRAHGINPGVAVRRYVAFHVRDDGPGLPEGSEAQIFEPFFTTKPVGAGTGLGLASARGFAQQSGGGLAVTSKPGCTTFTLYVPVGLPAR
ncbi:MAG: ATP-binding protein, partial [Pseudomonadota bacterium]